MNRFTQTVLILFCLFATFLTTPLHAQIQMPMDTIKGPDYTLIIPKDITVECSSIPEKADPIVISNCPNAKTNGLFDEISFEEDCSANYTIFRLWDIYTPCQKHFEVTQEIYVVDTKGPTVANFPADVSAGCGTIPAKPHLDWTDNCSKNPKVSFNETTVGTNLVRKWTAYDPCGNVTIKTQNIALSAAAAKPYFSASIKDVTVDCKAIPAPTAPKALDACDTAPKVTMAEVKKGGRCANHYTLTRTWTATNSGGQTATIVQVITVDDKKVPVFTLPTNVTVACTSIPKALTAAQLKITDNCAANATVTMTETKKTGTCLYNYSLNRVYTVTDACANKISKTHVVTVADKTAPTLVGVPANITIGCTGIPVVSALKATDICSKTNVVMNFKEAITPGTCPDNYSIKRTWTMTDECKNTATRSQTITVLDKTKPVFDATPVDVSVAVSQGKLMKIGNSATDNCDKSVAIAFSEALQNTAPSVANGQCTKYLYRTWTATDNCKNTASVGQNIYVIDDIAPVIYNVPASLTLDCGAPLPAAPTNVFAIDTMGLFKDNINVSYHEKTTAGGCNGFSNVERFWTAIDACNNVKTVSQKITYTNGAEAQGLAANYGGDKALESTKLTQKIEIEAPDGSQNYKVGKSIDNQSITTVEVFTMSGQQLFSTDNFGRAVVQLNQHPAGVYLMKISDGKTTQVRKFAKN